MKHLYVYILKCANSTYYTGITNNLEKRLQQHQQGVNKACYTARHLPVSLVFYERYSDFSLAIKWEKRIKRWSKEKKEALISNDWNKLKTAALKHKSV